MTAKKSHFVLEGKIVDIVNRRIFKGRFMLRMEK